MITSVFSCGSKNHLGTPFEYTQSQFICYYNHVVQKFILVTEALRLFRDTR